LKIGFIPRAMYVALLTKAHEKDISVAKLKFDLLRYAMYEKMGFVCKHPRPLKWGRNVKQMYCGDCFTFFCAQGVKGKTTWVPEKPFWEMTKADKMMPLKEDLR
jgi:hypothetical protein